MSDTAAATVALINALNAVEQGNYVTHLEDLMGTWMGHTVYFFRDSQGYSGYAAIAGDELHTSDDLDGLTELLVAVADKPVHRHEWSNLK